MRYIAMGLAFFVVFSVGLYFVFSRDERKRFSPDIRFTISFKRLQQNDLICAILAFSIAGALIALIMRALAGQW